MQLPQISRISRILLQGRRALWQSGTPNCQRAGYGNGINSARSARSAGKKIVICQELTMKLNCLIIDDEPVARKGMEEYVKEVEFLQLIAKCENPMKAAPYLEQGIVDLIFLDIRMPKISGIEFLIT